MYNVIIVDDEPIVRLALRSLVHWEDEGFSIFMEASNGKQALKVIKENHSIDIIITDINMPVMDGLEFISKLKELGNTASIIVLSAYDDYNLVRQAFKLGINDYILKTEMNSENILMMLKNIVSKEDFASKNSVNVKEHNNIKYLKEEYLKNLLDNVREENSSFSINDLGIKLTRKNLVACFLWIDDYEEVSKRYNSDTLKSFVKTIINSVNQVLLEINLGEVVYISPQEYVVLLSFEDVSYANIKVKINEILGKIRHALENYLNIHVTIGVSDLKNGLESVKGLFEQAEKNSRLRFMLGKGKNIFPEDDHFNGDVKGYSILGREEKFIFALKEADREETLRELEKLIAILSNVKPLKMEKIYGGYMEIIFVIIKLLNEMSENITDVFEKDIDFYEEIIKFETLKEINQWINNITLCVVDYIQVKGKRRINKTIVRSMRYIRGNFRNSRITLKMVSDYVELSESHFSTLFTKEVGETVTDYITYLRIEEAKELIIKTNFKVYEICENVGYTNTEHFSRVFKKITGVSPNAFKRM